MSTSEAPATTCFASAKRTTPETIQNLFSAKFADLTGEVMLSFD